MPRYIVSQAVLIDLSSYSAEHKNSTVIADRGAAAADKSTSSPIEITLEIVANKLLFKTESALTLMRAQTVSRQRIQEELQRAAVLKGYPPAQFGSHSLRVGGAPTTTVATPRSRGVPLLT